MSSGKKRGDAPMRTCGMLPDSVGWRVSADQSQRGDFLRNAAQSFTDHSVVVGEDAADDSVLMCLPFPQAKGPNCAAPGTAFLRKKM